MRSHCPCAGLGVLAVLALPLGASLAPPANAQMTAEVQFAPGNYGTMLEGTITGHAYMDYHLGAKAGQTLFVELDAAETNGHGSVYFNILPPGSEGYAIFNSSMSADNTGSVELPETGTYTIRVYLMGNDRDADKTVSFRADVSIQ